MKSARAELAEVLTFQFSQRQIKEREVKSRIRR